MAHLPYHKTLDTFDFGFQPSIDARQVRELATLQWVDAAANLVALGPPGVGNYAKSRVMQSRGRRLQRRGDHGFSDCA
jgi:DNA replication protein DnaC